MYKKLLRDIILIVENCKTFHSFICFQYFPFTRKKLAANTANTLYMALLKEGEIELLVDTSESIAAYTGCSVINGTIV